MKAGNKDHKSFFLAPLCVCVCVGVYVCVCVSVCVCRSCTVALPVTAAEFQQLLLKNQ